MTTDTAHATDESVAPPTPDDYELLREYLDANGLWANRPWPCVLFIANNDRHISGPEEAAERVRDLRAAWWTRLTAPRREAHADPAADKALEDGRECCGWSFNKALKLWATQDMIRGRGEEGMFFAWRRLGLTTRQLRARIAFWGATGLYSPRLETAGGEPVYPEAVPQADPAHGVEPCGCAHRGPYRHEIERFILVPNPYSAVGYTELRHDRDCKWCRGTGNVRDGRGNPFSSGYVPGEKRPIWLKPGGDASLPEAALVELEHRREQPDAFGHPRYMLGVTGRVYKDGPLGGLARAPLAELLHEDHRWALPSN